MPQNTSVAGLVNVPPMTTPPTQTFAGKFINGPRTTAEHTCREVENGTKHSHHHRPKTHISEQPPALNNTSSPKFPSVFNPGVCRAPDHTCKNVAFPPSQFVTKLLAPSPTPTTMTHNGEDPLHQFTKPFHERSIMTKQKCVECPCGFVCFHHQQEQRSCLCNGSLFPAPPLDQQKVLEETSPLHRD